MLVVLIGVLTLFQIVSVTDLSGVSLHCSGQMADSVCGIVWVSALLMSMLWMEWPMEVVWLRYGQASVMDEGHRCILLMAF